MTTLIVEIDSGGDPVEGRIGPSPLELCPFHGWAEFAAAIERFRPAPVDAVTGVEPRGVGGSDA